jgi:outer membrane protein
MTGCSKLDCKIVTFIGVVVASICTAPLAPKAETLTQALTAAYENSQLLQQNRYVLRVEDENAVQAVSQLYPVIGFTASAARNVATNSLSTTVSLVIEYTLYQSGQRRNAILAAQETVQAARHQLRNLEQQVLLDATTAYYDVWRNVQVVGVREANVRVLSEQVRAARDRFEVGEDTRTDVALAEAQLAQARSDLAAARGNYEISRELFALAVGRYPSGASSIGRLPNLPASESEAERLARQTHPAIEAFQHEVAAAESIARQARGQRGPTIALTAQGTNILNDSRGENFEGSASSNSIALTLSQPIFRGGQLLSVERQAMAQVSAARFGLNQQTLLNVQAVGNAYAASRIAQAQVRASEERIRAAELALEGVQEEVSLGARTTLDVLNAEQNLLEARISRIQAQADYFTAAYSILAASGLMTVSYLDLPVQEYDPDAYGTTVSSRRPIVPSPQGDRLDQVLQSIGYE